MYLGIDIGTSSVKAALIDDVGVALDQVSAPLSMSRPAPLWSEQDPADWWSATNQAVNTLDARLRKRVRAVGLSGQMHGAVLLDQSDRVLRPAILWNDGRSEAECLELERLAPKSRVITGNLAMPGFTAPKLIWTRRNEPELFAAIHTVLLPKDYVRLRMTGEKASDLSDAAGTLWVDVARRCWSEEMLGACGLSTAHMPRLCEGVEATGRLRAELAKAWGMERVVVAAGAGDNAAGAVGMGVIDAGDAFLSLGTSGVLFVAGNAFLPNPDRAVHAFCHALPERWHQMSVLLSAASCVDWAARASGAGDAVALLDRLAARARMDGHEIFLPYLAGERTPHNDPHACGVLFGLDHDSDGDSIGQAVLEGVAFAFADGLEALTEAGASIDSISVIGGGARSPWWGSVLAAALQRPLIYRDGADLGPVYGAARLAQIAESGARVADICKPPPIKSVVQPDEHHVAQLQHKRDAYRSLYPALRTQFRGGPHHG